MRTKGAPDAGKHSHLKKGPAESCSARTPRTSRLTSRRSAERVNTEQGKRYAAEADSVLTKFIPAFLDV